VTRLALSLVLLTAGCGQGQAADVGAEAALQVKNATFFAGQLPSGSNGPSVDAAYLGQTTFPARFQGKSFSGVLSPTATAVAIGLDGDSGYWIVPAGPPLTETPDHPSFDAALSFGAGALPGPHDLLLAAVDEAERFGPRKVVALTLSDQPLPEGELVFSLFWDRPSDLDLQVVLPDGVEVDKDNINSFRPSGAQGDADAASSGGLLDFDSNAQCRIDGRNNENVVWSVKPPSGRYQLKVATFSLCSEPAARWSAEARFEGRRVASSSGVSLPSDTLAQTNGVTAFELWVP
jgi:hypothetical protein